MEMVYWKIRGQPFAAADRRIAAITSQPVYRLLDRLLSGRGAVDRIVGRIFITTWARIRPE